MGMVIAGIAFLAFALFQANFAYLPFAVVLLIMGIGNGLFASPNIASIMNSVPPEHRGAASGMRAAIQNSASTISIAIFFTIIIVSLSGSLPGALSFRRYKCRGTAAACASFQFNACVRGPVRSVSRLQPCPDNTKYAIADGGKRHTQGYGSIPYRKNILSQRDFSSLHDRTKRSLHCRRNHVLCSGNLLCPQRRQIRPQPTNRRR